MVHMPGLLQPQAGQACLYNALSINVDELAPLLLFYVKWTLRAPSRRTPDPPCWNRRTGLSYPVSKKNLAACRQGLGNTMATKVSYMAYLPFDLNRGTGLLAMLHGRFSTPEVSVEERYCVYCSGICTA